MALVQDHPHYIPAGFRQDPQPVVETGCASQVPFDWWWQHDILDPIPAVKDASYYAVFLIVVPQSDLLSVLEPFPEHRRRPQEFTSSGGRAPYSEVRSAVYVTKEELKDLDFLACWLAEAAGLGDPSVEPVSSVWSTCLSFYVEGADMEPTFSHGTLVVVNPYGGAEPQRGDIVVFRSPVVADREFIKRVIGLPGDTIQINESTGTVIINGTPLVEPYANSPTDCSAICSVTIPDANTAESIAACGSSACYFVLSDNRPNRSDSGRGWLVPAENIVGWVDVE
jgi:signal peptidase I